MSLREIQQTFYGALRGEADVDSVARAFVGSDALAATERLEVYANMYLWRQVDVLREDFPALTKLLGDDAFFALARDYVRAHPSEHPSLSMLGRRLAEFISTRSFDRPDLSDLAALEWSRDQVFFADPSETISQETVAAFGESVVSARFELIPALEVLTLAHDVGALWQALEENGPPPEPQIEHTRIAVWRVGFEVFHARVSDAEAKAVELARTGKPLAEICEAFASEPDPVQAAFAAVSSWVTEGWIARVVPAGS